MWKINISILTILTIFIHGVSAQEAFVIGEAFPFGRINTNAPSELSDYEDLIGLCDCVSMRRTTVGTFTDTVATFWRFKYIMDGMAIQDESWKEDGIHSSSIRQFNTDSLKWHVTYFSSSGTLPTTPQMWTGKTELNGNIVLYKDQKAPNGTDGYSRLTFSNISSEGFNWIGEWIDVGGNVTFPFWKIECKKM